MGKVTIALANKAYQQDIVIKWADATMIKTVVDVRGLTTIEAMEIEKRTQKCLINDNTLVELSAAWKWCVIYNL